MILLNGTRIKPTIFPDKTSQVWKLDESLFKKVNTVEWIFEDGKLVSRTTLEEIKTRLGTNIS